MVLPCVFFTEQVIMSDSYEFFVIWCYNITKVVLYALLVAVTMTHTSAKVLVFIA